VRSKLTQIARQVTITTAVTCLFIVLAEGLSSTTIALHQMLKNTSGPEVNHYDESLGWTSSPDVYLPDVYGPGEYVRTNSRGFRNDTETHVAVPDGKIRIICSGDSFTYGEGVANNRNWCHLLSVLNDTIDTVNLGQPGYGVDQMYLRYLRDGIDLDHSVHIFAFIGSDFQRMGSKNMYHYEKPVLNVKENALVVENVPVPYLRPLISRSISRADFRSVDLAERLIAKIFTPVNDEKTRNGHADQVASMTLKTINRLDLEKNILPVFVYLPVESDIRADRANPWYKWATATMDTLNLPFIDLTPELQAVPAGKAATFFIPTWRRGAGHYSIEGNKWVAETLYKHLMKVPGFTGIIEKASHSSPSPHAAAPEDS